MPKEKVLRPDLSTFSFSLCNASFNLVKLFYFPLAIQYLRILQ